MKKMYTKIIVLLVFLIGGLGCVKSSKNTESGLTTITLNTKGMAKVLDDKIKENPTKFEALKLVGVAALIVGYNEKQDSNTIAFQCYAPTQGNDKNSEGCITKDTGSTSPMKSQNQLKVLFGLEKFKGTSDSEKDLSGYTAIFAQPGKDNEMSSYLTDTTKNLDLGDIKIKYNKDLTYYGYMMFECKGKNYPVGEVCMLTTTKKAAPEPTGGILRLTIPLKWTQNFGGGAAVDITGTGELPDGSSGDVADVEITPEVQ